MAVEVGDWIQVDTTLYTWARKGTIGYVVAVFGKCANIRPLRHPDLRPVNRNIRTIEVEHLKLLPPELAEDELDAFIDLALKERNKKEFYEWMSRKGV